MTGNTIFRISSKLLFSFVLISMGCGLLLGCKFKNDSPRQMAIHTIRPMDTQKDDCMLLTDFKSTAKNKQWRTVNDNVMGGRSKGGFSFENETIVFSGAINTNGGGFSSVRMDLNGQSLKGFKYLKMRLRTKNVNREYRIIMEDKDRSSIVYRSPIPMSENKEWREVSMPLADFEPSRRGELIENPSFEKDAPETLGLMLNDTGDGDFKLEVDWIKLCK